MKKHLLFVEDDATFRGVLEREMIAFGYDVTSCESGEAALEILDQHGFELALLDLRLPGMSGIELLKEMQLRAPEIPVVFLTGHGALPDAVRAMRAGAYDFLVKPAPLDELELTLDRAIQFSRMRRENLKLRELVLGRASSQILGESPPIQSLRETVRLIGPSEENVLIYGENGTGKELVARSIHEASGRRDAPFVVMNCGAIPSELFESELFGHRQGAFTGADRRRLGLVSLAEHGTLFLDEIGELPLSVQPAILRMVQFGEFRPVGAEVTEQADIRIVAATNRDIANAPKGEFREDLYHRLSTLGVIVPPLRERGADIEQLAQVFLDRANANLPSEKKRSLTSGAIQALLAHRWTGNVRELENVIVRLVTLSSEMSIRAHDVERHLQPIGSKSSSSSHSLDLSQIERRTIIEALRLHHGHRSKAAAELGIAIKTLYNKARHYSIAESEWSK